MKEDKKGIILYNYKNKKELREQNKRKLKRYENCLRFMFSPFIYFSNCFKTAKELLKTIKKMNGQLPV